MWFLTLIQLFNATANQNDVINNLRIPMGGIPLGIMEVLSLLILIYAIFMGGSKEFPSRRASPGFAFILVMLIAASAAGSLAAFINDVDLYSYLKYMRELGTWPIFIFVGYRMLRSPKSARYYAKLMLLCGILTASVLCGHFGAQSENVSDTGSFNYVRTVWYVSSYAGQAAMLLAFSLSTGDKILPAFLAIPLACFCMAGQFAPLHRVEWLGMFLCGAGFLTLIPKGRRFSTGLKGVAILGVLAVALLGAMSVVSNMTHRDFGAFVSMRLVSMLPIERESTTENKAWDTRLGSLNEELVIWTESPLIGKGPGIQESEMLHGQVPISEAYHHNGWAAILAQEGIIGLIAYMSVLIAMFLNGRKLALHGKFIGFRWIGVLNFMGSLFGLAEVSGSTMWTTRLAIFYGVLLGMSFRCLDMIVDSPVDEDVLPPELEYPLEPLPQYAHSDF